MPIDKLERLAPGKSSWFRSPFKHARRVYLNFLQFLFRPGNATGLSYNFDPKVTDLAIIEGGGKVNKELVDTKPVITVATDAARLVCQTFGSIQYRDSQGMIKRKEQTAFTLVTSVIANDADQAEELAWFFGSRTMFYQDFMAEEGFFKIGQDITWPPVSGAASVIEGDIDGYFIARAVFSCVFLASAEIRLVNFNMWNKLYVEFSNAESPEEAYTILIDKEGA